MPRELGLWFLVVQGGGPVSGGKLWERDSVLSNETCDVSDATIETSFIAHVRYIAWAMFSQPAGLN